MKNVGLFLLSLLKVVVMPPVFLVKSLFNMEFMNVIFAPWQVLRQNFEDVDFYEEWHWGFKLVYTAGYWYAVYFVIMVLYAMFA